MSPFDELTELRSVLTVQEIAETTGLRRETLSRARPDSRFQRRTQKALDDLYVVVTRLRATAGPEPQHLFAILSRPQATLAQRSIAELLKEGSVDQVLEHLSAPAPAEGKAPEDFEFDPEMLAQLGSLRGDDEVPPTSDVPGPVDALLAADAELASRLPAIEAAIRDRYGSAAQIDRAIIGEPESEEPSDQLYLRVHSDLPFAQKSARLGDLLADDELFGPVMSRLTVGWL